MVKLTKHIAGACLVPQRLSAGGDPGDVSPASGA
jgi:hypothetical protein